VIFMAGARAHRGKIRYTRSEVALRHGAGLKSEAGLQDDPYRDYPDWQPGPPPTFDGLPFA
jgi:hypothetical protein